MGVNARKQRAELRLDGQAPIKFITMIEDIPSEEFAIGNQVEETSDPGQPEQPEVRSISETSENVALMTCFDYFNAIKAGDYVKAHSLTTKTWQSGEKPEWFGIMYTGKLLSFEIDAATIETKGNWLDVSVKANWLADVNCSFELIHRPRLICEVEPYKPAAYEHGGVWGVNPVSALRFENDEDKETELP